MARLIDADELMIVLKEEHDNIMQDPEVKSSVKWREAVVFHSTSQAIRHAPTVDAVEVVHGLWQFVEQRFYHGGFVNLFRCSECKVATDRESSYCPNCGAKMDGDGNG